MPSDVSEAIAQDQIAESLVSEPEAPAETAETVAEEQVEAPESETEQQAEEKADNWLPSEQEKVFPLDVLVKFGSQRYGYTQEEIQADPRLQNALKDKLNTDIYLKQIQDREEEVEEPAPAKPEPTQPQLSAQEWAKQLDQAAQQFINPEMALHFANGFLQTFGVKEAATPEMATGLAKVFTSGVINVVNSILPQMLNTQVAEGRTFFQDLMGKNYEGFDDTYESSMYDRAWSSVAKSNSAYSKLPDLNTEGGAAARQDAASKIAGSVEDFDAMQFKGTDGKPLSAYQTAVKKYSMLARVMAGDPLTPQQTKQVFEAGQKSVRKQQVQREAGNLGSGKSNGQIASNQTDADFWKEGVDIYQREHGRL